ncbi:MAG: serine hydrolase domain-containing protein, partial [Olleya sp.]
MKKIIILFSFLVFSVVCNAQKNSIPEEVKAYVKSRIDNQINVGIVVGYIDGDTVEYFSNGNSVITNGTPVNEESVFEIGSISKTFTTTLLALKVNDGSMRLEDPISKYLPKSVKVPTRNDKEITLLHLATHTSGLPRMPDNWSPADPNNPFADYTFKNLYDFISNYTLTRDIGAEYEYSNLGMGLL